MIYRITFERKLQRKNVRKKVCAPLSPFFILFYLYYIILTCGQILHFLMGRFLHVLMCSFLHFLMCSFLHFLMCGFLHLTAYAKTAPPYHRERCLLLFLFAYSFSRTLAALPTRSRR